MNMTDMARKQIIPAGIRFLKELSDTVVSLTSAGIPADVEKKMLIKVSDLVRDMSSSVKELEELTADSSDCETVEESAVFFKTNVLPAMAELRSFADELEMICPADIWPMPTYSDLLFSV